VGPDVNNACILLSQCAVRTLAAGLCAGRSGMSRLPLQDQKMLFLVPWSLTAVWTARIRRQRTLLILLFAFAMVSSLSGSLGPAPLAPPPC